jgi:Tfp pilus assembly protein PilE
LIELLVVISIVALLISILLPALGKARLAADAMMCGSGLRTLAQVANFYAADNKGYMAYADDWSSGALPSNPYAKVKAAFNSTNNSISPTEMWQAHGYIRVQGFPGGWKPNPAFKCQVIMRKLGSNGWDRVANGVGMMESHRSYSGLMAGYTAGTGAPQTRWNIVGPYPIDRIVKASSTAMIGDAKMRFGGGRPRATTSRPSGQATATCSWANGLTRQAWSPPPALLAAAI